MNPNLGIRSIGTEVTGTASTSIAKIALESNQRNIVIIGNGGSVPIYLKFTQVSASAPTITATNFNWVIQAGDHYIVPVESSLAIWCYATSSCAYTALPAGS